MNAPSSSRTLLEHLVAAERAALEAGKERESFRVSALTARGGVRIWHPGFHATQGKASLGWPRPDLEDLREQRLIRVRRERYSIRAGGKRAGSDEQWFVDITPAGYAVIEREHVAQRSVAAAGSAPSPSLAWPDVLPVLEAVYRAESKEGVSPEIGVSQAMVNEELGRGEGDEETSRVLERLVATRYLEETMAADVARGPRFCRLAEKGLQAVAGWPLGPGEGVLARFLEIVEERIRDAPNDEERSKWERLRDGVLGVGRDVVTGVLTTAANAAAKGMVP